jgi:hypothetical protein
MTGRVHIDGVEYRLNPDGTIDEIVARNVDLHLEQMRDSAYWIGITTRPGMDMQHVDLWTPRTRIRIAVRTDHPTGDFGEFSSGIRRPA